MLQPIEHDHKDNTTTCDQDVPIENEFVGSTDGDERTLNALNELRFPSNTPPVIEPDPPRVEWVYPTDYEGSRPELGSTVDDVDRVNEQRDFELGTLVIDPNDVEVTVSVEGRIVPERLCLLKICGFVVCDDTFPFLMNPKILFFIIGSFFIAAITAAAVLVKRDVSSIDLPNLDKMKPNETMSGELSKFVDSRISKITQAVFEISGNVTLDANSSQNKALDWILYDDDLKLNYNSSNLLQRYSLMVFFFSLSGENWFEKDGYGSGKHECEWYGISCRSFLDVDARIVEIVLVKNGMKGQIPNEISSFSRLERLDLNGNLVSGSIPNSVEKLGNMKWLELYYNRLTGTIPAGITKCKNLVKLSLHSNMISGSIPEFSSQNSFIAGIILQGNKLTGTIPTTIGTLNAITLDLSSNRLTGSIPTALGSLSSLQMLRLDSNHLIGTVPTSIGKIFFLTVLDLSHNLLSGMVPATIYRHPQIRHVVLNDNSFTGTIPGYVDFLPRAGQIDLYGNLINGTIPEILGELPNLKVLGLHFSLLSGEVPQGLCNRDLDRLTVDCADVSCSCCTECF